LDAADSCETPEVHLEPIARARQRMPDEATVEELAGLFRAMADPTRVRILHALSVAELCVCDLAALLGLSPSSVSHQLRLLLALRLVRRRKAGRNVIYRLDDDHVTLLFRQGLEHVLHR
jgi:ArsR family transcriptional regulator